jgi:predicted RNA-binding Zn-ribbon protein involved in translation (DUF1610 family)
MTTLAATTHESRFTMIKSTAIRSCLLEKWPDWFILSAGGILALAGAAQVLGFFQESPALDVADPIFGCPFRDSILIFGIVDVTAAMFCLFAKGGIWIAGFIAWVVANMVVYRAGLWFMGWHHPYTCLFYLLNALDISPVTADGLLSVAAGCLLTGSVVILLKSWFFRRSDEFVKISCHACGGHIKFSIQNLGRKISCPHCQKETTLRKNDLLKMSCVLCGGHVEFPSYAVGQKIPCPHCAKSITLLQPS